jgi:hypothetical protein
MVSPSKLRSWWAHRQGLDGTLAGESAPTVLQRTGWARSVGGVGPYLTLFSRAGLSRQAVDEAVAALEIHELPVARGCTYVVPAEDFGMGLTVGRDFAGAEMRVALKLGVTEKEIDALCAAVLKSLANGPRDPDGIREATGNASRSLGEEGKKKGLTTTLPLALGRLQVSGEIRRIPVNGRLDQQRYQYARWKPSPLAAYKATMEDAFTQLARKFFRWVGPATLGEFQWFSALGVKAVREITAPLGLVPSAPGSDRLLLPEDVDAFAAFKPPAKPRYALVSSLDPISATRRDLRGLLDAADFDRKVVSDKTLINIGGLSDLPSHAILDRGRLIGFWEYDFEKQKIVWGTFGVKDKALQAAVLETERFVRDDLGDARSFSLDSPKSRASRIESLRRMA